MRQFVATQMPSLDAVLTRFDGWWAGLSQRERAMVGGLALFLAVLVLVFGVVKPLQGARAQALADIRQYETLNARIRAAGRLAPAQPPLASGPPAQIVSGSASRFGVVATVVPAGGGVRATVADSSYEAVLAWIADVSKTSALSVARANIARGTAAGHVSASVEFVP